LGNDASTGGGPVGSEEAVVIVHGITNKITRFNVKENFQKNFLEI